MLIIYSFISYQNNAQTVQYQIKTRLSQNTLHNQEKSQIWRSCLCLRLNSLIWPLEPLEGLSLEME